MARAAHARDDFAGEERQVVVRVWGADAQDDVVHALLSEAEDLRRDIVRRADERAGADLVGGRVALPRDRRELRIQLRGVAVDDEAGGERLADRGGVPPGFVAVLFERAQEELVVLPRPEERVPAVRVASDDP